MVRNAGFLSFPKSTLVDPCNLKDLFGPDEDIALKPLLGLQESILSPIPTLVDLNDL